MSGCMSANKSLLHVTQDRVIILDERGKEATSHMFASILAEVRPYATGMLWWWSHADVLPAEAHACVAEQAGNEGVSGLVFAIGGPYGHSEAVRARGDMTLRLSACVLNHQVRGIFLLSEVVSDRIA